MKKVNLSLKKKLLLLSGVMFSCGIAVSATATYAWYSIVEKGYITDLNIEISTEDMELKMGIVKKGETEPNYDKSHYTKEDFPDEYEDGKFYLKQVSGMYKSDWLGHENLPKFRTGYSSPLSTKRTPLANGDEYLQHEFYLLSTVDCAIMLGEETNFNPLTQSNAAIAHEIGGVTGKDLDDIQYATRVSFLFDDNYVVIKKDGSIETKYAGLLDLANDGYYDYETIMDGDNKIEQEVIFGEYFGTPRYLDPVDEDIIDPEYQTGVDWNNKRNVFIGKHKAGVRRIDRSSVTMINEGAHAMSDYIFTDDRIGEKLTPLTYLTANTPKRVVITTYLEGWDLKMTDLLNKASLDVTVSFVPLYNYPIFD